MTEKILARPKILKNRAKCLTCGETIESKHVWDYRTCKCGQLSVDGGKNYLRRCGILDKKHYKEMSVME